jgi:hypothetical protein
MESIMPFDPVAWGLGYVAKTVADSLLTKAKSPKYLPDYHSLVDEWAKQDTNATVHPAVFLQAPIEGVIDLRRFIEQDGSLSETELTKHFLDRWKTIKSVSDSSNLTDFFHLEEAKAAELLRKLAEKIVTKDRKQNGAFVTTLRELIDDDIVRRTHMKAFVAYADFASDKRVLYTELAVETKAPLGALYESSKALRNEAVGSLISSLRDTTYHQNVIIVAKTLRDACVAFMKACETLDEKYGFGLTTGGQPIERLPTEAVEDVQASLLAFRASFCGTLISVLSELGANVPVSIVAGLRAGLIGGGTWPLREMRLPCESLLIDGIQWRMDELYINRDEQTSEPYIRIGTLESDAVVQGVYLPEGTCIIQHAPCERKKTRYGGFYSITPGRNWHVDKQLVLKGENYEFQ